MYDLVIIGAGPAGLTAGIYAMRGCLKAITIEAGAPGGQVLSTYEVDNYPALPGISGMDLGDKMKEHAKALGMEFVTASVTAIEDKEDSKCVKTNKGEFETKAVILATGAKHALLGAPGEKELQGAGVSYCATCDGAFYKGADVAVVGGGDVAIEDAIYLARNCNKVYLIHRRNELRGAKKLQEALMALDNVQIIWDSVVEDIQGVDEGELTGLLVKNVKTNETSELLVEGLFVAVGIVPDTEFVKGYLDMDEKGYIIAGEDCKTSKAGIYVCGDCRTKNLRQIVTAVADGANAVNSVLEYLI